MNLTQYAPTLAFSAGLLAAAASGPEATEPLAVQTILAPAGASGSFQEGAFQAGAVQEGESLLAAVDRVAGELGHHLYIDEATRALLQRETLRLPDGATGELAWALLNIELHVRDFATSHLRETAPRVTAIRAIQSGNVTALTYRMVEAEALAGDLAESALLVRTVVDLPNLDVRQLANSLRAMLPMSVTSLLPIGNSNTVVLSGRAAEVAGLLQLVSAANAAAGEPVAEPQRGEAGAEGPRLVSLEELAGMAGSEEQVRVVIQVEGQDVRQLSNSMRALITQPGTLIVPGTDGEAMVISGSAFEVGNLVEVVLALEAGAQR